MTEEEYDAFWTELCAAQEAEVHGFEDKHVFEGCMPVEVMARRGKQTLCYGPLKPRGLNDPKTGKEPFAVVQLRRDNADGTIYNLVGFQTHLKWPEQRRVFSMIPALRNAEFVRYGVMHRNTDLDSPRLLDRYYRVKKEPRVCFAGQITGVEGYVESTASGFLVAVELARRLEGRPPVDFPQETAVGALAVDRHGFARAVTEKIRSHPLITVEEGEVTQIPESGNVIVASGPLTSDPLAEAIRAFFPESRTLNFYDAAAPLVTLSLIHISEPTRPY